MLEMLILTISLLFGLIQTVAILVISFIFKRMEKNNDSLNSKIKELYHDLFSHRHEKENSEVFIPGKFQ